MRAHFAESLKRERKDFPRVILGNWVSAGRVFLRHTNNSLTWFDKKYSTLPTDPQISLESFLGFYGNLSTNASSSPTPFHLFHVINAHPAASNLFSNFPMVMSMRSVCEIFIPYQLSPIRGPPPSPPPPTVRFLYANCNKLLCFSVTLIDSSLIWNNRKLKCDFNLGDRTERGIL